MELFHEKNHASRATASAWRSPWRQGPRRPRGGLGPDFYAALDLAAAKLENRLRRAADRRRVHHGRRTPASVRLTNNMTADTGDMTASMDRDRQLAEGPYVTDLDEHLPGRVVREKQHPATPMTVDQALHEMELVGHDFFLFQCADTGQPTVVYRRHAYDYGLIRLTEVPLNGAGATPARQAQPQAVTTAEAAAGGLRSPSRPRFAARAARLGFAPQPSRLEADPRHGRRGDVAPAAYRCACPRDGVLVTRCRGSGPPRSPAPPAEDCPVAAGSAAHSARPRRRPRVGRSARPRIPRGSASGGRRPDRRRRGAARRARAGPSPRSRR